MGAQWVRGFASKKGNPKTPKLEEGELNGSPSSRARN
jgi:hypothetical protein